MYRLNTDEQIVRWRTESRYRDGLLARGAKAWIASPAVRGDGGLHKNHRNMPTARLAPGLLWPSACAGVTQADAARRTLPKKKMSAGL